MAKSPNGQADVEWRRLPHVGTTPGRRPLSLFVHIVSALDDESTELATLDAEVGIVTSQHLDSADEIAMTMAAVIAVLVAIGTVDESQSCPATMMFPGFQRYKTVLFILLY